MQYVMEKGIFVREISGNCQGSQSSRFGRNPVQSLESSIFMSDIKVIKTASSS